MNARERAQAVLSALGAMVGLPLLLDDEGACGLRIDGRLDVTLRLHESPPAVLAYTQVGALPAAQAETVLRRLLVANHVWEGSDGATWSVSDGQVALARLWPLAGLEAVALADELAHFAEIALAEQTRLVQPGVAAPAVGLPPGVWAA